jgi:hypothetical protein
MTVSFFIILVIALALIIGPIAMLAPKPAQRNKEALRLGAASHGVRFTMRRPPKLKTAMDEPMPMPVYYVAPGGRTGTLPEWMLVRTDYAHEGNFYQAWDWHTEGRADPQVQRLLLDSLPRVPASVVAISQGEAGTCIFWGEREGAEALDILIRLLKGIQEAQA